MVLHDVNYTHKHFELNTEYIKFAHRIIQIIEVKLKQIHRHSTEPMLNYVVQYA